MRKPVFRVSEQVRHNLGCTAKRLEISMTNENFQGMIDTPANLRHHLAHISFLMVLSFGSCCHVHVFR